jgi:hypothetical protein
MLTETALLSRRREDKFVLYTLKEHRLAQLEGGEISLCPPEYGGHACHDQRRTGMSHRPKSGPVISCGTARRACIQTSAYAVIIGVDDYAIGPLTSAVRDAVPFRSALLELKLVQENEVTLLTSPAQPGGGPADRATINAVTREVYDRGVRLDRFYFFFAGHGLTAWTDAARSVAETALVPSDAGSDRVDLVRRSWFL